MLRMNKSSSQIVIGLFHSRWFYIVNVLLILIVVISFTREMIHSHDIAMQIQALQKQSQTLQTQHLAISDLKNAVQTELFAEKEARLKLGLKKPGESLIILKNEKASGTITASDQKSGSVGETPQQIEQKNVAPKPLANSTRWWYYFFNKQAYRDAQSL